MAKKPVKKTVKKPVKKPIPQIPQKIIDELKKIHERFYKDEPVKFVKELYLEELKNQKETHKGTNWNERIFQKRTITAMKNKMKRDKLGGSVDNYYGIIIGESKVRDLSEKRRAEIVMGYEEDPDEAMNNGLIMTRTSTNPQTGEEESVPLLDNNGNIIPRDNREFFKRKNGSKFKNQNFDKAIPNAYRKTIVGFCSNMQEIKGLFIMELRDKSTTINTPSNILVKFSAKTPSSDLVEINGSNYYNEDLLETIIMDLEDDLEQEIIDKEYKNTIGKSYQDLLDKKKFEVNVFKLRSSKGTTFIEVKDEKEFGKAGFPMKNETTIDVNLLCKQYLFPFSSDCSNLLKYHNENKYIDGDPEKVNWDEIVALQDVNMLQINLEASMSGNYTLYVEDDSLFSAGTTHLDENIDSIRLLVPSHVNLDFGQDSKVIVIGSPFQFQAQDEDNNNIFETITNEEGKEEKIKVLDFPLIMVYGIFPIPEYKVEVETLDLTHEDEIDVDKLLNESEDLTEEEVSEMEEAITEVKKSEEKEAADIEEIEDEDMVEGELW